MVAVDASVVVKWFVEAVDSADALRIRDAYVDGRVDLRAPTILPYEVSNALKFSDGFDREELESVTLALSKYDLDLVPFHRIDGVVETAIEADVTVYEAAYVAVGAMKNEPMYTADRRLLDAVDGYTDVAKHVGTFQ